MIGPGLRNTICSGATSIAAGLVLCLLTAPLAQAEWPTEGGDKGAVVEVTSLADSGARTLRAALGQDRPRRIVFTVGGEVFLKEPLVVRHPHVTIAGETAPSPGISLIGDKLRIRTHDVIVRDIRLRVGEGPGSNGENRDGISIDRAGKYRVGNILIDRCSVAWAVDENVSVWGKGISNVLVRRTIVAEALSKSVHPKGEHSMGLLVGAGAGNVVVERNLLAHNVFRNPAIDAGATAVVVNNVIYNPGWSGFHVYAKAEAGPTVAAIVGNVLIAGPDTRPALSSFPKGINPGSKIYYDDNLAIGAKAFAAPERDRKVDFVDKPPIWFPWLEPLPAGKVEDAVLADVGARPTDRDATDRRIIAEVLARTGSIKDTPPDLRLRAPRPLKPSGGAGG
jgi:hypothetical protein